MKRNENITGFRKFLFYVRMSLACAWRYWRYPAVLMKASQLTRIFFKHKLKRLASGEYKLDFYLPRYPSQAFFTALEDKLICRPQRPVSVVLSISKACAYKCPHCYQRKDDPHELPLPVLIENVRKMRDFGIVAWAVEGGEPLLRFERLEAVLAEIAGLEVWVNSTGHGATPEKIRRLAELKVTGVMSSIHSVDEKAHDAFTGVVGSWRRALDFLHDCREAGMLVGFNTVLTDPEVVDGGIDRIMALAAENNCDYIQLIHPKACGAWMGKAFDKSLHAEAVRIACEAQRHYNSAKSWARTETSSPASSSTSRSGISPKCRSKRRMRVCARRLLCRARSGRASAAPPKSPLRRAINFLFLGQRRRSSSLDGRAARRRRFTTKWEYTDELRVVS